jgi:hypothetical protein
MMELPSWFTLVIVSTPLCLVIWVLVWRHVRRKALGSPLSFWYVFFYSHIIAIAIIGTELGIAALVERLLIIKLTDPDHLSGRVSFLGSLPASWLIFAALIGLWRTVRR